MKNVNLIGMKTRILILLTLFALTLTSCVKQKNCDCGLTGKFVYLDKEIRSACGDKITAVFVPYGIYTNGYIDAETYLSTHYIAGYIPNKFRKNTDNVTVCVEEIKKDRFCVYYGISSVYKLTCIEKEE